AAERNDLVFLGSVGRNELDDRRVDRKLRKIDGRNAVLTTEERGDVLVLDEPHLDEVQAEFAPVGLLVVQRLLELIGADAPLLQEEFTDADRHEGWSRGRVKMFNLRA